MVINWNDIYFNDRETICMKFAEANKSIKRLRSKRNKLTWTDNTRHHGNIARKSL